MADFVIRKNDRLPELRVTLTDATGVPVDLTGATVEFHMKAPRAATAKVDAAAIKGAGVGEVRYPWAAADTNAAGRYWGEFEVTFGDGRKQTFPNQGYTRILVTEELG